MTKNEFAYEFARNCKKYNWDLEKCIHCYYFTYCVKIEKIKNGGDKK